MQMGFEGMHYALHGPHRMVSTTGGTSAALPPEYVKPIDIVFRSGLFGPWDKPEGGARPLTTGMNPAGHQSWGLDSFQFFPNFVILVWEGGWYLTYHYWPLAVDRHLFEGRLYFRPPKNASERLAAGARGGHVQGVRAAGRQHARGHAEDAEVARGHRVPAVRPGSAVPPPAQGRAGRSGEVRTREEDR